MRPLPTAVSAATAAALTTLAVIVTVPAIGADMSPAKNDSGPTQVDRPPDVEAIRTCLKDHGATVPDGDGRALKNWAIGVHTDADKAALEACGIAPDKNVKTGEVAGPDEATLRACLKDHDVTVPDGDGGVLKQWIAGDHTGAEKQALKTCGLPPDIKMTNGPAGSCGTKDPEAGTPGDRVKPGELKKPATTPAT